MPASASRPAPTPRAVVVFESMFGNTADIAAAVARGLDEGGLETTCVDVRDADRADALDARLLVLGAPTHAFSLSRPATREGAVRDGADKTHATAGLREWIAGLEPGTEPPLVATFDTRARQVRRLPVGAGRSAARLVRRQGLRLVGDPAGFVVEDTSGPLAAGEVERAVAWGRGLATVAGQPGTTGHGEASPGRRPDAHEKGGAR